MILAEYGLHLANEGDHLRCVEHPEMVMLHVGRYRVGEREYGSLEDAVAETRRIEQRVRELMGRDGHLGDRVSPFQSRRNYLHTAPQKDRIWFNSTM